MDRRQFLISTTSLGVLGACTGRVPPLGDVAGAYPPIGKIVNADGLGVHAWESGTGRPVVMIHGAGGNLRDFTYDVAPMMAQRYRAIAFDRPGFGYTDRPAERGGDPAVQARVLAAAAREMGVERPILVGHSLGAAIAMAWALAEPDNVAGVVSVSGAVMPWSERPMLAELIGLDEVLIGYYFDYLSTGLNDGTIERFIARNFRPQTPPPGYIEAVGIPLALRPDSITANKEDIASLNTALRRQAPDYARLTMPVEVVSGAADPIIRPASQPIPFNERLRNSRLTLLENIGHMAHHAAPDEVIAAVARIETTIA